MGAASEPRSAARPVGEERWLEETANAAQGVKTQLLAREVRSIASDQDLVVFHNPTFGRVMMLDGVVQLTDVDEFIYHEMMAHVPLFAHGAARRVLVLGGGDGGIAREVLRHRGVESLDLVEIDRAVVDLARAEFPRVSDGAFDDGRLKLTIADGAQFVATTDARYDVMIVDSPDPVGAGAALFTEKFYADCASRLAEGGVMVTQSGMPFLTPDWLAEHAATLRAAFPSVAFYLSTVPSYTGGPMAHGFLGRSPNVSESELEARWRRSEIATRYWTPAVHRAAFALPPYIGSVVAPQPSSG